MIGLFDRAAELSQDESHGTHSIELKRQIAQEFVSGGTLHALAIRPPNTSGRSAGHGRHQVGFGLIVPDDPTAEPV